MIRVKLPDVLKQVQLFSEYETLPNGMIRVKEISQDVVDEIVDMGGEVENFPYRTTISVSDFNTKEISDNLADYLKLPNITQENATCLEDLDIKKYRTLFTFFDINEKNNTITFIWSVGGKYIPVSVIKNELSLD